MDPNLIPPFKNLIFKNPNTLLRLKSKTKKKREREDDKKRKNAKLLL